MRIRSLTESMAVDDYRVVAQAFEDRGVDGVRRVPIPELRGWASQALGAALERVMRPPAPPPDQPALPLA